MNCSKAQALANDTSLNDEEILNYLAENKLEKRSAARLNKKIIEKNIPKAISQIASYLEMLKAAFTKLSRRGQKHGEPEAKMFMPSTERIQVGTNSDLSSKHKESKKLLLSS